VYWQVIEHQMGILDENRQIRSDLPSYIDLARRLDLALVSERATSGFKSVD
jgi:hypothetical protein